MIPNMWYAITRSQDVKKTKPHGIERMGKRLVLYRDASGELVCMDDRCPHKGVLLSLGKVHGDRLACPYHGFQYDQKGDCVHMPVLGQSGVIPDGFCVKTYVVKDKYGMVWFWNGEEQDEYPEIPMFEEFANYDGYTSVYGWEAPIHYTRYVESVCEVYHVPFIHRGSALNIWDPKGGRVDNFKCEVEGNLIKSDFVLRLDDERSAEETLTSKLPWKRGWNIGVDVLMPGMVLVRNDVFETYLVATPIDDKRCWVCFCYKEPKRDLFFPFMKPLPIPFWRPVRPWMMCRMERFIQQAKDMAVIKVQDPVISSPKANQLIHLDKVNAHYIRLREQLIRRAKKDEQKKQKTEEISVSVEALAGRKSSENAEGANYPDAKMM